MKILRQAQDAGLTVKPVTYRGHRRKGYDITDPTTGYIQYTLEPRSYPKGYSNSNIKWLIHDHAGRIRYVVRVTAKDIDLTRREITGMTERVK